MTKSGECGQRAGYSGVRGAPLLQPEDQRVAAVRFLPPCRLQSRDERDRLGVRVVERCRVRSSGVGRGARPVVLEKWVAGAG